MPAYITDYIPACRKIVYSCETQTREPYYRIYKWITIFYLISLQPLVYS